MALFTVKRTSFATLGVIFISLFLFPLSAQASTTPVPPGHHFVTPAHVVTCRYTPYTPYKNLGVYIKYGVSVSCNDVVDARGMVIRLWRYNGNGGYSKVAESNSSNTGSNFSVGFNWTCSPRGWTNIYHTEVIADAFHGNWDTSYENSPTVALTC